MSDDVKPLNCQIENAPDKIFVGDHFDLVCSGYDNTTLGETVYFEFKEEGQKYTLQLLHLKKETDGVLRLDVTSYKTGEHKDLNAVLTDGLLKYSVGPMNFQVNSVLKQEEEQKPVPSIGPLELSLPVWYWIVLGVGIAIFFLRIVNHLFARIKKKKLIEEMQSMQTMLSAFGQFNKDMRHSLKQIQNPKNEKQANELLSKMQEDFQLYLVRELMIPAHKLKPHAIIKELKSEHKNVYGLCRSDIEKLFLEFEKADADKTRIDLKDCEQVFYQTRKVCEKIYAIKGKK
jgi:hypothetical protein